MSDSLDIAAARKQPGLRLVLTAGAPGPWGEAVKGMLHVKKIPFVLVRQEPGSKNPDLVEWTGIRNAPQLVPEDNRPIDAWVDLIHFAELREPNPALIPSDVRDRAAMFGLINELAGRDGFAWNRRLQLFRPIMELSEKESNPAFDPVVTMAREYGYSKTAAEVASHRIAEILGLLSERLAAQRESGSRFLIGARLSALDIHWAAFCGMVSPLEADRCPMPDYLRQSYDQKDDTLAAALNPALVEHRDFIYAEYLELPVRIA